VSVGLAVETRVSDSAGQGRDTLRIAGLAGEVSADARGKRVLSGRCVLAGGETGPFRCRCEDRGPRPAETLAATGRPAYTGVGSGESRRKSRLILETTEPLPIEKDS
jgi:hypothetical protein